jgi:hypothetical protein
VDGLHATPGTWEDFSVLKQRYSDTGPTASSEGPGGAK